MSAFTAFGPATLSNLGPGFDALGLCITGPGDRVTATRTDAPGVTVEAPGLPTDPEKNTAGRAARHVLRQAAARGGLALVVEKGIPLGSGVGGSAASAVAGAWAANLALGRPFAKADLVEAVLAGEAATGSAHGDNVLPALLGGLVMVSPSDPTDHRAVALGGVPPLAVVLPEVTVLTRAAREALPATVPHSVAAAQAAELAFLMRALLAGDWHEAGRRMMADRLAEPYRAPSVPVYDAVQRAALAAGAAGCVLSGSGPAMVAVCPDADADAVLQAMAEACARADVGAQAWLAEVDPVGVREVPS